MSTLTNDRHSADSAAHPDAADIAGQDYAAMARNIARSREAYDLAVSRAAYFLAQTRGFQPGHELDDWVIAEKLCRTLR